ncbi:MAG: hypothetical protein GX567_19035 [Clostridia bacterium]|nr:hypothetical protein [Clostridia bacterium]
MGTGSYTSSDWNHLRGKKGLTTDSNFDKVFVNRDTLSLYDSRRVQLRESRDSAESPNSTPIIIGFDATASMGYLAKELAVNSLNNTIMSLYENQIVSDPHILCSAIGDCKSDRSPLQVTQFEADIRIIEQLTDLFLEGGGGGNGGESYNLLWYFAARHTQSDCYEKRQKKGFLFTIGDDQCHKDLSIVEIRNVFNDQTQYSLSNEELLRMVREKYHVFHIHIETGHYDDQQIVSAWKKLLPGYATTIHKHDICYLSFLITAIMAVTNGADVNQTLKQMDQSVAERIARSMALIHVEHQSKCTISF